MIEKEDDSDPFGQIYTSELESNCPQHEEFPQKTNTNQNEFIEVDVQQNPNREKLTIFQSNTQKSMQEFQQQSIQQDYIQSQNQSLKKQASSIRQIQIDLNNLAFDLSLLIAQDHGRIKAYQKLCEQKIVKLQNQKKKISENVKLNQNTIKSIQTEQQMLQKQVQNMLPIQKQKKDIFLNKNHQTDKINKKFKSLIFKHLLNSIPNQRYDEKRTQQRQSEQLSRSQEQTIKQQITQLIKYFNNYQKIHKNQLEILSQNVEEQIRQVKNMIQYRKNKRINIQSNIMKQICDLQRQLNNLTNKQCNKGSKFMQIVIKNIQNINADMTISCFRQKNIKGFFINQSELQTLEVIIKRFMKQYKQIDIDNLNQLVDRIYT